MSIPQPHHAHKGVTVKLSRRTRAIAAVAGAASIAIIAAGCSPAADSGSEDGAVELTVATFNDFGYTDELLQEYMDENPNVTVVQLSLIHI